MRAGREMAAPRPAGRAARHRLFRYSAPSASAGQKRAAAGSGDQGCACLSCSCGTCKHVSAAKAAFDTAEPAGAPAGQVAVRRM